MAIFSKTVCRYSQVHFDSECYILTLDRTVNQECISVNKRKNSRSRWTLNNNITRCQTVRVIWTWDASVRISFQTEGFGPSVTHGWATQPRWRRSAAMVEEEPGVNIAVCPRLQLISHTQETSPFQE